MAMSETDAGWAAAESRVAHCAKCPALGGACENEKTAVAAGRTVSVGTSGVTFEPCPKWARFLVVEKLRHSGVPEPLVGFQLDDIIERVGGFPLRDEFYRWLFAVQTKVSVPSVLVTGGKPQRRTEFLAGVAHALIERSQPGRSLKIRYTFGPRLAVELRDHVSSGASGEGPLGPYYDVDVLIFDFLDPQPVNREPWKEWFIERVDQLLWKRLSDGKPTIMSSRMRLDEFTKHFTYAAELPIEEVPINDPKFGPLLAS